MIKLMEIHKQNQEEVREIVNTTEVDHQSDNPYDGEDPNQMRAGEHSFDEVNNFVKSSPMMSKKGSSNALMKKEPSQKSADDKNKGKII